ncbi:hypothetical protein [Cellulosimicrobium cellulans]|uniref:hypothetical protein n=1 Tax=Cellulosimicrobium cellulans TaxID=1710 RepID=UPI000848EF69|nr:hypothetical protein [Cellulosimicrobium cellulans]
MKKLISSAVGALLALGSLGVAVAAPSTAIEAIPPTTYVDASCSSLLVSLSDHADGTTVAVVVDGDAVEGVVQEGSYWFSRDLDWTVPHEWSVVVDAPDGTEGDRAESGTTAPCSTDPRLRVDVTAYCAELSVWVSGYPTGTAVSVLLDGAELGAGVVDEWQSYSGSWVIDRDATHRWEVVVDAADDSLDRSESGESSPCWVEPQTVVPETPAAVTDCAASPEDVVLPVDTDAVSYERTAEGIVATAALGYTFPFWGLDQWQRLDDGRALLAWASVVRPVCDLEVVSVTPVCDAGVPSVDVVVTPPAGADDGSLEMDWVGPDEAYDVLYGGGGFGHPFTSRQPWPAFITNEDGTVSPHHTPDWRVDDVDLVLGTSVQADGGVYSRYHRALWEDAPTTDPCADDPGPHFRVDARDRWLAGAPYLAVRVLNEDDTPADVTVTTPLGSRSFREVAPGASAYQAFRLRSELQDVPVTVTFTTEVDGEIVTRERVITAWRAW